MKPSDSSVAGFAGRTALPTPRNSTWKSVKSAAPYRSNFNVNCACLCVKAFTGTFLSVEPSPRDPELTFKTPEKLKAVPKEVFALSSTRGGTDGLTNALAGSDSGELALCTFSLSGVLSLAARVALGAAIRTNSGFPAKRCAYQPAQPIKAIPINPTTLPQRRPPTLAAQTRFAGCSAKVSSGGADAGNKARKRCHSACN